MAVRLDSETLLASVGPDLSEWGRNCLARGWIRDLDAEDGGASAVVTDPDCGLLRVWVGVIDGVLTGECDCVDGVPGRLCGHTVAVALKALEMEFTFSSISSRGRGVDPDERRFAAARLAKVVGDVDGETYLDVPEGTPMFWAWRAWPSSRRCLAGRRDDSVRTAAVQRP